MIPDTRPVVTDEMMLVKTLDPNASLLLSEWTGEWYVSARIEIGGDGLLQGITEHRRTPWDAVFDFVKRLKAIDHTDLDHFLVAYPLRRAPSLPLERRGVR